jgi:GNAT superfamily N-acetyltransferase
MLELARGLTDAQLDAVSDLEQRVVRHDGGRLKLEWGHLRNRPENEINDVLFWEGAALVGFLGLYAFGGEAIELVGMVDPGWRRRGIGSTLLEVLWCSAVNAPRRRCCWLSRVRAAAAGR